MVKNLIIFRFRNIHKKIIKIILTKINIFHNNKNIVFLCNGFVDNNSYALYHRLKSNTKLNLTIITDNEEERQKYNGIKFYSFGFVIAMLRAKIIVLDHLLKYEDRFLASISTSLYLDHSIPPKKAQEIYKDYSFDYMISTSNYTTNLLKKVYNYNIKN